MAERKEGDGSFRAVAGEVLRAPLEFALKQRKIGSRLQNTILVASLLGIELFSVASVVQKVAPGETVSPQDFLSVVGLNLALYVAGGLLFYAGEHHSGGPFVG